MDRAEKSPTEQAHTRPAAEPVARAGSAPDFTSQRAVPGAQSIPADMMNDSPRMVAQRRQIQQSFAGAAQLAGAHEAEPLQGRFGAAHRPEAESGRTSSANNTGLPDTLKSGIESLSGMSMDHVKVHYNSSQPARLNALAYAQGHDIHLAPGQERHLPHEAWHVVQQAKGRVAATTQMKGVPVNDDTVLEDEADAMGAKAMQLRLADGGGRFGHASGLPQASDLPAAWASIAQMVELPDDSVGTLRKMKIIKGDKEITGDKLQVGLIKALSKTGKAGFGYRLVTLKYDNDSFEKDERDSHVESHGMEPWAGNIDDNLEDIKLLVRGTLSDAGQLKYLQTNSEEIGKTHEVIVDVDWYRERTQSDVGFHKDSRGTTLFVNLTYDNDQRMQGATTKPDYEGQPDLEKELPKVVTDDLEDRRNSYPKDRAKELDERSVGRYARVSFSDPSVWHSTPLLGHRIEKSKPPTDLQTLEAYLPRAGYEVYCYRGILKYYEHYDLQQVYDYFKAKKNSKNEVAINKQNLESELRLLGYTEEDLKGYQGAFPTIEGFWAVLTIGTDRYNKHGISDKITPRNKDTLNSEVEKSKRRLSRKLDTKAGFQQELDEEAKRPRTFIRTWVRLIKRATQ